MKLRGGGEKLVVEFVEIKDIAQLYYIHDWIFVLRFFSFPPPPSASLLAKNRDTYIYSNIHARIKITGKYTFNQHLSTTN